MNILHIAPHYGGGIGTVVSGWLGKDHNNYHLPYSLERCKEQRVNALLASSFNIQEAMENADIVLVHYWNHPMLAEFFSQSIPDCRLAFWCHKNIPYSQRELDFPDLWVDTSPIQGHGKYIWSTGNIERFLKLEKKEHEGFNVGTIASPKLHEDWFIMCEKIKEEIPEARFTVLGDYKKVFLRGYVECKESPSGNVLLDYNLIGKVDDVAPYLAEMDVFFYPLRPDHYGTCEQALGEAMAAGIMPICMDNPAERFILGKPPKRYWGMIAIYDIPDQGCIECVDAMHNEWLEDHTLTWFRNDLRKRARKLYSIDTMISKWNEVFESMMKQPKKERGVL